MLMAKPTPIYDKKTKKLKGSIGVGKTNVPVAQPKVTYVRPATTNPIPLPVEETKIIEIPSHYIYQTKDPKIKQLTTDADSKIIFRIKPGTGIGRGNPAAYEKREIQYSHLEELPTDPRELIKLIENQTTQLADPTISFKKRELIQDYPKTYLRIEGWNPATTAEIEGMKAAETLIKETKRKEREAKKLEKQANKIRKS